MNLSKCAFLAALAGGICAGAAQAQIEAVPFPPGMVIQNMVYDENEGYVRPATGYEARAPTVYDSLNGAPCPTFLTGASNIIDDVSFGPTGPWATTTNNVMRTIQVPYGNGGTTLVSFDFRVTVWDSLTFTANPMIPATAVPLWRATFPINNIPAQSGYTLTITPATPVTLPDNQVYVQIEFFQRGLTTLMSNAAGQPARFFGAALIATGPGSSTNVWGIDLNNNNIFNGGVLNGASSDHRRTNFTAGTCNTQAINLPVVITGDVPITPPVATALGAMTDASNRADAAAAGQVKWYSFSLTGDVTDAAATYLDIYSTIAGTPAGVANTAMALFSADGNIIAQDELGGPDDLAQLSFGIGRRAANGNGEQFDGYDRELLATDAGVLYLAVCQGPATFSDGFIATPAMPGTAGTLRTTFRSNIVSGTLGSSVAPVGNDLGQILGPGAQTTQVLPGARKAVWYKFNVCRDIAGGSPDSYFDIDFGRCDTSSDPVAYLFNSSGNVVATSDDSSPTNPLPILSFGDTTPRGPYTTESEPSAGADGVLFAGDYYLAVGLYQLNALPAGPTGGRWHMRPLSGSNLNIQPDFYTGIADCSTPCPPCAADFDQSGGIDGSDIQAFFEVWATGEVCGDTNQDGAVDGSDVEAFFLPWQAGTC